MHADPNLATGFTSKDPQLGIGDEPCVEPFFFTLLLGRNLMLWGASQGGEDYEEFNYICRYHNGFRSSSSSARSLIGAASPSSYDLPRYSWSASSWFS